MPPLVALLKRRRKKLSVLDKMTRLYKEAGWRLVEDRVLGMIQLWADTFMMQEDRFPVFMCVYRELRKEGMKFPPRDPNERYVIKYEGEASPAFELAEMEGRGQGCTGVTGQIETCTQPSRPSPQCETPTLLPSDIETIRTLFPLFERNLLAVHSLKDLQTDFMRSLARTCRQVQKKLTLVVSSQPTDTLDLLAFVNVRMEAYTRVAAAVKQGGDNAAVQAIVADLTYKERVEKPIGSLLGADFLEVQEGTGEELAPLQISIKPEERKSLGAIKRLAPPPGMKAAQEARRSPREAEEDFFADLANRRL